MKTWVADAARRSGLVRLLKGKAPTNVVFALHRVLPGKDTNLAYDRGVSLRAEAFAAFLNYLQARFELVSLNRFVNEWTAGRAQHLAVLTFDDGWIDNHQFAFPLLREHRVPATIFLPTGLIGTTQRLPEERIVLLWKHAASTGRVAFLGSKLEKLSGISVKELYAARAAFKTLPLEKKLSFLDDTERELRLPDGARSFVNWEEVREMQRQGISFGSHTHGHSSLPREADEAIRRELQISREDLLRETGEVPEFLAYPNGLHDERVQRIAEEVGFKAAFTTHNTFVSSSENPMALPRVAIDDTVFAGRQTAFSDARAELYLALAARASRSSKA